VVDKSLLVYWVLGDDGELFDEVMTRGGNGVWAGEMGKGCRFERE
jgi:hypothetical protein